MTQKAVYQAPKVEAIRFDTDAVLSPSSPDGGSSSGSDGNQGEWDPQSLSIFS